MVISNNNALRVAVLLSGRGSNLAALLQHQENYRIIIVISNRPNAGGLSIAAQHKVPTIVINHQSFNSRSHFDHQIATVLDDYEVDLIVLGGFMRILTAGFVEKYSGRIINLHPSLLPDFPGLHPHRQALATGASQHGATVHFVIPELDAGPIIAQGSLPIKAQETEESLKLRTLEIEHQLLPRVVSWFAAGRLRTDNNKVFLDNELLPPNGAQCTTYHQH